MVVFLYTSFVWTGLKRSIPTSEMLLQEMCQEISLSNTFHDLLGKLLGSFFKKSKALLEIKAMLTIHISNFKTNILIYDHSLRLNVPEISLFHRRHWVHLGQNLPIWTRTPNGRFRLQCAKVLFSHYLLYLFHSQFRAASWFPKYYCQLSKYTSFYSK